MFTARVLCFVLWLPLIWLLADLAVWGSPSHPEMEGSARAAAEVPRQIANAHTMFNVINTVLFIGFRVWIARLAERLIPEHCPFLFLQGATPPSPFQAVTPAFAPFLKIPTQHGRSPPSSETVHFHRQ